MQPNEPTHILCTNKELNDKTEWHKMVWGKIKDEYSKPQIVFIDKVEGNVFTATNKKHDTHILLKSYGFKR